MSELVSKREVSEEYEYGHESNDNDLCYLIKKTIEVHVDAFADGHVQQDVLSVSVGTYSV